MAVGAALVVVTACSGDDAGDDAENDLTTVELTASSDVVSAGPAGDELAPVDGSTSVGIGDQVSTDEEGRAELVYEDGSVTRLDHDTTVNVIALQDPVSGTRIGLEVGRVWQRVERLSGSDQNEIVTPVAVASVRGTEYSVTCTEPDADGDVECFFTVVEGRVAINPETGRSVSLGPGQRVQVDDTGPGEVETLTPEALAADSWIVANSSPDSPPGSSTTSTSTSPSTSSTAPGTSTPTGATPTTQGTVAVIDADPTGSWAVTTEVVAVSGVQGVAVGDSGVFTYQLTRTCQASVCQLRAVVQETGDQVILQRSGAAYTGSTSFATDCVDGDSGTVLVAGGIANTVTMTIRPSRAQGTTLRAFTGSIDITGSPSAASQSAGCGASSQTNSLAGAR